MIIHTNLERFWEKVDKNAPNGCWVWGGCKWWNGYGVYYAAPKTRVKAHRYSWELHFGPIPDGLVVCHSCDNPSCVNPSHLWLGQQHQNVADRDRKGRHRPLRGQDNGKSKLSKMDARIIKSHTGVLSQRYLARVFGVAQSTIGRTQRGETYS